MPHSVIRAPQYDTFHELCPKHLNRFVQDLARHPKMRGLDTTDQTKAVGDGMRGKQLRCKNQIADNGLASGGQLRKPASA